MSLIITIANAVAAALNGVPAGTFASSFTAVRMYDPTIRAEALSSLRVAVVPKTYELIEETRSVAQRDMTIDIAVQKKVADAEIETVDPLMDLCEEIIEFVRATKSFGDGRVVRIAHAPIWSPTHMTEQRVFFSIITLTLRVMS